MKNSFKSVLSVLLVTVAILVGLCAFAQVPPNPVPPPTPVADLSMITNHAELVSSQFKKVQGIRVNIQVDGSADSWLPNAFFSYTNTVKTLEDIMGIVTNNWWDVRVVDTRATITIAVKFYDTASYDAIQGYLGVNAVAPKALFEGYAGGQPELGKGGGYVLPDWAEQVSMRLVGNVFVTMTNVTSAHLVYTNNAGQFQSMDLPVTWGQGFEYPPDFAGQGILVLTWMVPDKAGNFWWFQKAYDVSSNTEVPITDVLVRALITDSEDFRTSVDQWTLKYNLYSYQGFGKVPLLTPTYNKSVNNIYIEVTTSEGDFAKGYTIEHLSTGKKTTVSVPDGQIGVDVKLPGGSFHIVPIGLDLLPWEMYSWYGGGGKG